MSRTCVALGLAALLEAAAVAQGDSFQTFAGSTVGQPTFNRPHEDLSGPSGFMTRFQAQGFFLPAATTCYIYGAQDFDGFLHLYQGSFNRNAPLTNVIAGNDDADLGIGTSQLENLVLSSGFYVLVTSGYLFGSAGGFQNSVHCNGTVQPIHGGCFFANYPREKQTCQHERFAVRIRNVTNHASDGQAVPVRFGSVDSSFFWFFNQTNFEVMVKVLNGCGVNGHWWVFFAATTNQGFQVQVGDGISQLVRTYNRSLGPPSAATTDTQAFPCPR
jgi:hypothetical protein